MSTQTGDENTKNPDAISYKGSVSGLKGFLTNQLSKITKGFPDGLSEAGAKLIPLAMIFPNPDQPRQVFEPKSLEELASTMKEVGQAQAITVRVKGGGFEIISGERRYRAARLAGLTHLECVIKDVTDGEAQLLSLVENLQRQDLLPIEEAHYLKRVLKDNPALNLEKLAKMLGTHKSTLSEKIQLTEVPDEEQKLLYSKGRNFTHRHWRIISRVKDPAFLNTILKKALEEQLSVAELERALNAAGVPKQRNPSPERAEKVAAEWKAPVEFDSGVLSFRNSRMNITDLTPEKKDKIIQALQKIILELSA